MRSTPTKPTPLTTGPPLASLYSDLQVWYTLTAFLFLLLPGQRQSHGGFFVILLLFGPPGCGKGTQAVYLAERFHIPAISTGEMFRAECKAGTELGKAACSILSRGGLVSDDLVNGIVANPIPPPACNKGFLPLALPPPVPQP